MLVNVFCETCLKPKTYRSTGRAKQRAKQRAKRGAKQRAKRGAKQRAKQRAKRQPKRQPKQPLTYKEGAIIFLVLSHKRQVNLHAMKKAFPLLDGSSIISRMGHSTFVRTVHIGLKNKKITHRCFQNFSCC